MTQKFRSRPFKIIKSSMLIFGMVVAIGTTDARKGKAIRWFRPAGRRLTSGARCQRPQTDLALAIRRGTIQPVWIGAEKRFSRRRHATDGPDVGVIQIDFVPNTAIRIPKPEAILAADVGNSAFCNPDTAVLGVDGRGGATPTVDCFPKSHFAAPSATAQDAVLSAFHLAAKSAELMPKSTRMRATWVPALQAIRKVLRGASRGDGAEPEAALEEARARFDEAVRPAPPPPSPAPLAVAAGLVLLALSFLLVRRAREPLFRSALRKSRTAYAYTLHAAIIVGLLVVVPLAAGAVTSLFAGTSSKPQWSAARW
jgi:hypothetical protein